MVVRQRFTLDPLDLGFKRRQRLAVPRRFESFELFQIAFWGRAVYSAA
jgi:hypothetical protein